MAGPMLALVQGDQCLGFETKCLEEFAVFH
jgi:hypothetical protein